MPLAVEGGGLEACARAAGSTQQLLLCDRLRCVRGAVLPRRRQQQYRAAVSSRRQSPVNVGRMLVPGTCQATCVTHTHMLVAVPAGGLCLLSRVCVRVRQQQQSCACCCTQVCGSLPLCTISVRTLGDVVTMSNKHQHPSSVHVSGVCIAVCCHDDVCALATSLSAAGCCCCHVRGLPTGLGVGTGWQAHAGPVMEREFLGCSVQAAH